MDEFLASSIIEWYEDLEGRLAQYIKFTPFITQNLNVCSPLLAGVITEACNILDSLFREISPPLVTVNGKSKDRERLDITDYADLYAGRYNLPATKSVIFVSPPQYLVPFKAWEPITAGGAYTPLPWWTAHNKLKHDRIGHILDKSTLRNTVDALCGLNQVIAKLPELARATLRHGWLQTSDMNPEYVIEAREGAPRGAGSTFIVQSKLFALPVGREQFPDDIQALQPHAYGKSRGSCVSTVLRVGSWSCGRVLQTGQRTLVTHEPKSLKHVLW